MSDLELLDPTRPDDPAFDPDGAQATRVLAAALRTSPAPARSRSRRGLVPAAVAVAAAVAVVVTVGTSTAPPDALAALREAARQTAAIDSGRVLVTVEGRGPLAGYEVDSRAEVRFQGEDLEVAIRSRQVLPGRGPLEEARTLRRIDGVAYERDDTRAGGRFRELGKVDPVTFNVVGQVDDDALVELVKRARDVVAQSDGDVTTYRGTTTAGAVEDAAPTAHGRSQGGEWDREVRLELAVGEDGLIRHVTVRDRDIVRTTRYSDMGRPQTIRRP